MSDVSTICQSRALLHHTRDRFLNTVYTPCQLRLPSARYTHNTGTTSGKRVTEKPRERVHQWQNNTATICIRYIWCKQTQAGFVRSPRDYRLVRLLPEYNERHFYHADDKKQQINNNRKYNVHQLACHTHIQSSHTTALYNE